MSNNQVLISIIVPVHNVEQYLLPCLQSLSAQSHSNLEVFLVDDGSTDSSGKICDGYAAKDGRFHVIHTPCNGPGSARNVGLDLAKGEWIGFVDSDDALHPDYLKCLLEAAVSMGTDISACEYQELFGTDSPQIQEMTVAPRIIPSETAISNLLSERILYMVVWGKLYSKKLIGGIRFKTMWVEDTEFLSRLYPTVSQIAFLDNRLYFYYRRTGALSATLNYQHYKVFAYWGVSEYYQEHYPEYSGKAVRMCLNSIGNFNLNRNQVPEPVRQQVDRIRDAAWKIAFPDRGLTKEKARYWLKLHFPRSCRKLVTIYLSILRPFHSSKG